ncbi:MAG: hypothetical protein IPN18_06905 [Ignavibacteriales bacterium]|nr:hypothetical protein [Ignavibacteriales bacterium]
MVIPLILTCRQTTGGAEVVNYPWDSRSARHADDNWWQQVSRRYADTVHFYCNNNGYLSEFNNGSPTDGTGIQFMAASRTGLHTSNLDGKSQSNSPTQNLFRLHTYQPFGITREQHWLNLMDKLLSGVGGVVKSPEGVPVKVKVTVLSHDHTNAEVF